MSELGAQVGKTLRLDVSECSDTDEEEVMQQTMRSSGPQGVRASGRRSDHNCAGVSAKRKKEKVNASRG